jgi:hypothetical protein
MKEHPTKEASGGCPGEIVELLPWYLNNTLTPEERRRVEAHTASCSACRREIRQWQALQATVREMGDAVQTPMAEGLDALRRRIEQEREPAVSWGERLQAWLDGLFARRPVPTLALAVVAAQLLLLVGLTAVLIEQRGEIRSLYQTLSGPSVSPTLAPARLTVVFQEQATEAEIRNLLQRVQGTIAAGPSALGLYTIALAGERDPEERVVRALQELQRHPRVVKFAERAVP